MVGGWRVPHACRTGGKALSRAAESVVCRHGGGALPNRWPAVGAAGPVRGTRLTRYRFSILSTNDNIGERYGAVLCLSTDPRR